MRTRCSFPPAWEHRAQDSDETVVEGSESPIEMDRRMRGLINHSIWEIIPASWLMEAEAPDLIVE